MIGAIESWLVWIPNDWLGVTIGAIAVSMIAMRRSLPCVWAAAGPSIVLVYGAIEWRGIDARMIQNVSAPERDPKLTSLATTLAMFDHLTFVLGVCLGAAVFVSCAIYFAKTRRRWMTAALFVAGACISGGLIRQIHSRSARPYGCFSWANLTPEDARAAIIELGVATAVAVVLLALAGRAFIVASPRSKRVEWSAAAACAAIGGAALAFSLAPMRERSARLPPGTIYLWSGAEVLEMRGPDPIEYGFEVRIRGREVWLDGLRVSGVSEVTERLASAVKVERMMRPDTTARTPLVIRAGGATRMGILLDVLEAARAAGVARAQLQFERRTIVERPYFGRVTLAEQSAVDLTSLRGSDRDAFVSSVAELSIECPRGVGGAAPDVRSRACSGSRAGAIGAQSSRHGFCFLPEA